MCKAKTLMVFSRIVLPELAANDQLMKFWLSIAKPDVSVENLYIAKVLLLHEQLCC